MSAKYFRAACVLPLMALAANTYAQDTINKRGGGTIPAKIIEVNDESILFKRFDNLEGPTYRIKIEKVASINYENGSSDTFDEPVVEAPAAPAEPAAPAAAAAEPAPATPTEPAAEGSTETAAAEQAPAAEDPTAPKAVKKTKKVAKAPEKKVNASADDEEEYEVRPKKKRLRPTEDPNSVWSTLGNGVGVGIWADPVGFTLFGPMIGVEFRIGTMFDIAAHIRFGTLGPIFRYAYENPDEMSGIAFGARFEKIFATKHGNWHAGGLFDFGDFTYVYDQNSRYEREHNCQNIVWGVGGGYAFRWVSGFFIDIAGYLGSELTFNNRSRYTNTANSNYSSYYNRNHDPEGYIGGMFVAAFGYSF